MINWHNDASKRARGETAAIALTAIMFLSAACSQAADDGSQAALPQPAVVAELAAPEEPVAKAANFVAAAVVSSSDTDTDTDTDAVAVADGAEGAATAPAQAASEIIGVPDNAPDIADVQDTLPPVIPKAAADLLDQPMVQEGALQEEVAAAQPAERVAEIAPAPAADVILAGDPEAGKRAFATCRTCHTVQEGRNGLGPSLFGVVGREAGSLESFNNYSDAMKASGVRWSAENLDKYLLDSGAFIPGNKMTPLFRQGVQNEDKRRDIIAYLATQ